jgi:hypothetical protein
MKPLDAPQGQAAQALVPVPAELPGQWPTHAPTHLPTHPPAQPRPASAIHIERLVLDGLNLDPHQTSRMRAALEAELAGLLAGALPGRHLDAALASLPAVDLQWQAGASPECLGRSIASALRRALGDRGLL